ncbi:putative thioesterase TR09-like protein [Cladobotryum mycophilum]|uniref:Thioesterase TR09-like protein n=1 Tax=Cladobotryum mycophilum TaxID=491253 RepID=A0ABR0T1T7_9HYPO
MAEQSNPALIQVGDTSRAPLFLLHDSSGGTFSYYRLESLGRPVYAIHNPWLRNADKWGGGSMLFVKEYIKLIKSVYPRGDILVGGWSLGGQLGIDIGRVLAQDRRSKLRVIGVVMIDTLYPYWGPPGTVHADFPVNLLLGPCPPEMKEEILRCTQWTMEDSLEWVDRNWKANKDQLEGIEAMEPPPAVHLFATKYIPVTKAQNGAVAMTDYLRHERGGWNMFPHDFIVATWELPAHHFGLFEKDMIKETSDKVRRACDLLEEN